MTTDNQTHPESTQIPSSACEVVPQDTPLTPAVPSEPAIEATPSITIDDFAKVDLRVALIESVETLPKSKKLLKLQVDVGALGKRQILSGIAKFHQPEDLVGRKIIIIANLEPAKLMGEESQGMLLAVSPDDDSALALLSLSCDIPAGCRVR